MKNLKKIFITFIILTIIFLTCLVSGCEKQQQKLIVFLGDSIAEAVAGISPVGERENYGYYGIIGKCNDYQFRNRAVSGDSSRKLLNLIKEEDNDARITQTLLKQADIIHISILGNDILGSKMENFIISAARNDFTFLNSTLETSTATFADIVSVLRSYNEDAVIMFQTVYNPVFEHSSLVSTKARDELAQLGYDENDYRALSGIIIDKLNDIISNYLIDNPNEFIIIDANSAFEEIYQEDAERGKRLIFSDDVHPTDEGHAIMAELIQKELLNLDLANKKSAIKEYKSIKIDQLERLYNDSIDIKTISKQINKANEFGDITKIYFNAINNKMPIYS